MAQPRPTRAGRIAAQRTAIRRRTRCDRTKSSAACPRLPHALRRPTPRPAQTANRRPEFATPFTNFSPPTPSGRRTGACSAGMMSSLWCALESTPSSHCTSCGRTCQRTPKSAIQDAGFGRTPRAGPKPGRGRDVLSSSSASLFVQTKFGLTVTDCTTAGSCVPNRDLG